jgi:prolyl-tRNA synthetase
MNRIGAQEILTPTIQPADLWQESGRYDDYGKEMLRITDRHERPLLFGPTAEEVMTDLFRQYARSYRDVPQVWYQIQWKFRDEIRPRFGVMRGREFLMKDAYSFDADEASARQTYQAMFRAYLATFRAMGLQAVPVRAATGPIGGNLSHEFHILADTGESALYYDAAFESLPENAGLEDIQALYAAADELHDAAACPVPAERLRTRRGIEVGHIFYFGTKYSSAMDALLTQADGTTRLPAEMGSYGIGVSRLVGAIIEACHDDKGICWPAPVAPFAVHLVNLSPNDETCTHACDALYTRFLGQGVSVLYDDTPERTGAKLATADLLGMPWQVRLGSKSLAEQQAELYQRSTGEVKRVPLDALTHLLAGGL